MRKWTTPELETLGVQDTMQGKHISSKFDEIRVDQNGNYWAGFSSGTDSEPSTDGEVIVK